MADTWHTRPTRIKYYCKACAESYNAIESYERALAVLILIELRNNHKHVHLACLGAELCGIGNVTVELDFALLFILNK